MLPAVVDDVERVRPPARHVRRDPPDGLADLVDANVHLVRPRARHQRPVCSRAVTRHRQAPLHTHATARAAPVRLPVAGIDAVAAQPLQVLVKALAALGLHERLKVGAVLADERNEAGPQVAVLRAVGVPSQLVA